MGTSNELRSAKAGDDGRACSQLSRVLDCRCHLVGLSHETDMQRCAGISDIDPAYNLKGGYRYGGSRISFMWQAEDYRKNPTEIETVMMYWAQGFMSGAN